MYNSAKDILAKRGLRITKCRLSVLDLFLVHKHALTHSDIESSLKDSYDRVTLYRTLTSFLEQDIIHQIMDRDGANKYAISTDLTNISEYYHKHVHFKCINCGQTKCLPNTPIPEIKMPKGFYHQSSLLLVEGICNHCSVGIKKP